MDDLDQVIAEITTDAHGDDEQLRYAIDEAAGVPAQMAPLRQFPVTSARAAAPLAAAARR